MPADTADDGAERCKGKNSTRQTLLRPNDEQVKTFADYDKNLQ
jgi:hypothetical protein